MRIAFSTLSCPEWAMDDILRCCEENGYDGVEFRGLGPNIDLLESPDFAASQRVALRRRFADIGAEVCCVSSSVSLAGAKGDALADQIDACKRYAELGAELGAGVVRVFGGDPAEGDSLDDAIKHVGDALRQAGDDAAQFEISIGLETHDAFVTGAICRQAVRAADRPNVGILWDIHHPYRAGETVEQTLEAARGHLVHTHTKDGILDDEGKPQYRLLGHGDLPLAEMLAGLAAQCFPGYLSLEWEKRWHAELEPPEIALPQYASAMRELLGSL